MNSSNKTCVAVALSLVAALAASSAAADAPAIARLQYSADIGANLVGPGAFVARKDFVDDNLLGTRTRMQIAGLPDSVVLHDFHIETNGDVLFALDIGVALGGTYFAPADVVRFHAGSFSKEFDAAAAGVPAGVHCDGVARLGSKGALLLSFDKTFTAGAVTVRPADVIAVSGGVFGAKILDARALGLPDQLNVDAIDTFGTIDYLLVSFDTGGAISGIAFTAADVMQLHRTNNTWSKRFTMSTFSDRWNTANLDGLAAVNNDTIFQNDFE